MRISRLYKGFLRFGLFAIIAAVPLLLHSSQAETARRIVPPADRPPMFVLQVGIGKYLHSPTWAALTGSVNDVVEMRKVLESDRYGVPSANIITLIDEQGTKPQIFEKFRTHLIAKTRAHFEQTKKRDAVVMFEFSGHGSQVPDVDGDEKDDHKDETLVTYDSDDAPGKNYDITDDEIFALTGELRRYTDNIVYVFDSCHSGSGTRNAEDVRRLPERKTVPVPVAGVGTATRSETNKPEDSSDTGVLPPGDDYIVITAARSGELASQRYCWEECSATETPVAFGNLTFYLVDELKQARGDTSYRELMENVTRRVVAEKPTQTPQIEGDKSRFVFGALGNSEDNFTRIVEAETKKPNGDRMIKIRAGAMQGVAAGTIVSFYDKGVSRFDGADKVSGGMVTSVSPTESTVRLIGPKRELTVADKAVAISPDLGSIRLKVDLDIDAAKFSPAEKLVISDVRSRLTPQAPERIERRGIDLVSARTTRASRWDVAVLKDMYSRFASKMPRSATQCETSGPGSSRETISPDTEVLYLAGKDFVPLYGFCVEATFADESSRSRAAKRIEEALVHMARLRSINAISNKLSALNGKVTVRPVRLTAPFGCSNGKFTASKMMPVARDPRTGYYNFTPGDAFWFEITNNSPRDLYLALLDMPPDGSVQLFSPRERDDEKEGVVVAKNGGKRILMTGLCRTNAAGEFLEQGVFQISDMRGLDRFKIIASVDRITRDDFAYLEMPAIAQRTGSSSLAGMSDWIAIETIFQVDNSEN